MFHADLEENDKTDIQMRFVDASSGIQILLATEAMGTGIEILGLLLVVQYGACRLLLDSAGLKTLVQRMGRAARKEGDRGTFVWLVPPWFFPPPDSSQINKASQLIWTTTVVNNSPYEFKTSGQMHKKRQSRSPLAACQPGLSPQSHTGVLPTARVEALK